MSPADDAERALTAARHTAAALLAAEQVGGAQRLLGMTVAGVATLLTQGALWKARSRRRASS